MSFSFKFSTLLPRFITSLSLLLFVGLIQAQSLDPAIPAPVRSNQLTGRIAPRDLGDSRLTDHYFAFTGTPGDLVITVKSSNLNGDIDIFTAGTLRPLLKLTLYAESAGVVTKGIYLRKREDLVLRVEARSPSDDDGTYTISFSGSFEPIVGGPDIAETETPVDTPTPGFTRDGRRTKRVSSVGARINEPEPPVEVASSSPTPEPSPEATPVETPTATDKEKTAAAKPAKSTPPPRSSRGRRPAPRRTPAPKPAETAQVEETPKPEGETETTAVPPKPKSTPRNSARRTTTTRTPKPPPEPEPEIGPRLIIETNDGTLINRSMSTVRRVTVENGQVVVTGKDGKIDRIMLVNVLRMSIAP